MDVAAAVVRRLLVSRKRALRGWRVRLLLWTIRGSTSTANQVYFATASFTGSCCCGGTPSTSKNVLRPQGEYSGYAGTLGRLLREGASANDGLTPNQDRAHVMATKLLDWYGEAMRQS
jgi:hypothetical protein